MFKRIVKKVLIKLMRYRGYSAYFAPKVVKETINDFRNTKNVNIKDKMWAYNRGFFSVNIERYGLNEENFRDYMPDFEYYKLHPINGTFRKWIDDKMTVKYILSPFNEYLPEYYYILKKGSCTRLMDCPKYCKNEVLSILKLLKQKQNLAVKLIDGSLGKGFDKVSYSNGVYLINSKVVTEEEITTFLLNLENYIVTEYLISHQRIRNIFSETANNLRVMLVNDKDQSEPEITGAFIKFGTKKSGMIDHVWAGGIFCKVDLKDGEFSSSKTIQDNKFINVKNHPDTDMPIKGVIPNWLTIKTTLLQISNYIPQVRYMGFDIIITDDSFKIIDINSHQGINLMQVYY